MLFSRQKENNSVKEVKICYNGRIIMRIKEDYYENKKGCYSINAYNDDGFSSGCKCNAQKIGYA